MDKEVEGYLKKIKEDGSLDAWQKVQIQLGAQEGLTLPALQLIAQYRGSRQSEVRQGLVDGLSLEQVESYANEKLSAEEMRKRRRELFYGSPPETGGQAEDGQRMSEEREREARELLKEVTAQLDESRKLCKYLTESFLASKENELADLRQQNQDLMRQNKELFQQVSEATRENLYLRSVRPPETEGEMKDLKSGQGTELKLQAAGPEGSAAQGKAASRWREALAAMLPWKKAKAGQEPDIISIISNPQLDARQMAEISEGYKAGLTAAEVGQYANPQLSAEKMREIRQLLLAMHGVSAADHVYEVTPQMSQQPEQQDPGRVGKASGMAPPVSSLSSSAQEGTDAAVPPEPDRTEGYAGPDFMENEDMEESFTFPDEEMEEAFFAADE